MYSSLFSRIWLKSTGGSTGDEDAEGVDGPEEADDPDGVGGGVDGPAEVKGPEGVTVAAAAAMVVDVDSGFIFVEEFDERYYEITMETGQILHKYTNSSRNKHIGWWHYKNKATC